MVALVPVLSDLDARKSDRRLERDQAKRLGNAVGQIRRQRRNAVGLRRYNCAGDEARHPQQNIRWRDICRENALFRRMELLIEGKSPAAALFNGPYYLAEQLGFRKVIDTTFMIAAMIKAKPDPEDIRRYFRALRKARSLQRAFDASMSFCKWLVVVEVRGFNSSRKGSCKWSRFVS